MLDIMYDLPSIENVQECIVNEEVITEGEYPVILYKDDQKEIEAK